MHEHLYDPRTALIRCVDLAKVLKLHPTLLNLVGAEQCLAHPEMERKRVTSIKERFFQY